MQTEEYSDGYYQGYQDGWDAALEPAPPSKQEPVAWVEVHDTVNGPYEFHGMNLLPKGRHHLFTAPPSKPINFLVNGTRYKIRHQGYYGCSIVGLSEDLNGQWVALVDATDDKHLQCTAPPSKPCEITDLLQQKFQSGNNVPVERVTITRSEYEAALRSKNNG